MQSRDNFVQLFIILFSDKISNSCDFFDRKTISFLFDVLYNHFRQSRKYKISLDFPCLSNANRVFNRKSKCDVARTLNFFYTLFSTVHLDIYIYQNDHKCKVLIKN